MAFSFLVIYNYYFLQLLFYRKVKNVAPQNLQLEHINLHWFKKPVQLHTFLKSFPPNALKVSRIAQQKNVRTCLPVKMICIRLEMLFRVLIWCCVAWKNAVERLGKHVHGKAYTRLGMLWTRRLPATYGLLNHCVHVYYMLKNDLGYY